ncbi:protein-tyrosine phosphatase [Cladophialophora psammophila CBS 110553]|uniref:phosphatidylinositol-3,4,5-trisphosphate 3-phosphatase n=1 Tax=Cladophialophora psammophila CBS 110553 TaxID=1182543 RepID=W9XJN7_9EURO|nr:protein-tyrosine phosphatase [Cladophialophora psammophila CBS 110553]EXJ70579.1 protein-tyrosine phosphatase [Cladophialophora psammophila CBS 110553]
MASLLRQIVAGPRARHPEAGLDLCYVTDYIVVTSGPSSVWPRKAYRNPLDQLVGFLDRKHGEDWAIFEFRAEGTGYPDSEVYNRIHHFPWPDHHPPPFAIIPNVMAAMRNWIQRVDEEAGQSKNKDKKRVAVIHCKAGKGRSGTVACSYLISEEGWKKEDALQRFTMRRMRPGFGLGVSIPSQLRWVGYVDRWANGLGKRYVERPAEIVEIHVWGLRDGVKVSVEGYIDGGRRIHTFHTFNGQEKTVVEESNGQQTRPLPNGKRDSETLSTPENGSPLSSSLSLSRASSGSIQNAILKPSSPLILPTSDINVDFERRNKAGYTGLTMVTAIAHVWFNAYFEGGHEGHRSGVFEIEWEAMDGIKGSSRKGTRALDRLKVVWKYAEQEGDGAAMGRVITEPEKGEPVPEGQPANWRGEDDEEVQPVEGVDSGRKGAAALTMSAMVNQGASTLGKELGIRKSRADSANISRASSVKGGSTPPDMGTAAQQVEESEDQGVKQCGPEGEELSYDGSPDPEGGSRQDTKTGHGMEAGMAKVAHVISKMRPSEDKAAKKGEVTDHQVDKDDSV